MRLDGEAERGVERIDRPVPLCCRHDPLVAYVGLDGRLGGELAGRGPRMDEQGVSVVSLVGRRPLPGAPVGDDAEGLDPEQVAEPPAQRAGGSPHQQLERPVCRLEVVAVVLEMLQGVEDTSQSGRVELEAQLGSLQLQRRAPRQFAHDDPGPVAHDVGRHMLVGVRPTDERARVQTCLVRERGRPHIGPLRIEGQVDDLGDVVGHRCQALEPVGRDRRYPHLQAEIRDDRRKVRVPRAFAVAVDAPLDMARTLAHGLEGVGHRAATVVVEVAADLGCRVRPHVGHDPADLVRQRAAVGVAEHEHLGACLLGRGQDAEGEFRVPAVAVEECSASKKT